MPGARLARWGSRFGTHPERGIDIGTRSKEGYHSEFIAKVFTTLLFSTHSTSWNNDIVRFRYIFLSWGQKTSSTTYGMYLLKRSSSIMSVRIELKQSDSSEFDEMSCTNETLFISLIDFRG